MTFLPIVSRELLLASRRGATYWLRSIAALVVMAVGTWVFLVFQTEPPKDLAMVLFYVISGGAVLVALSSGPRSTADCISEEKREGTLGLLFLTDLRGYDVILGKLFANSFNAFYTVVAMLPMMAIPLLMGGGITLNEVGRMALVTINALFFSLTLGIAVSALSRSALKASAVSALLILFFVAGWPACGAVIAAIRKSWPVHPVFLLPSTGFTYYLALEAAYKISKMWFWVSLATINGLSWLSLFVASLAARLTWKDRPPDKSSLRLKEHWRAWTFGYGAERAALRTRLLDLNPILWLVARMRSKPISVWLVLAILACGWVWGWWRLRRDWLSVPIYISTAVVLNFILRIWFASEAAWVLSDNRKSGGLELLLSTPLRIEDILRGQWLALKRQFLGPILAVIVVEGFFMAATVREAIPDDDQLFWYALWFGGILMFVADLVALYWLCMWRGLTARNALRAAGGSLGIIFGLPWVAYGVVLMFMILTEWGQQGNQTSPNWQFFFGLWFGLGIAVDFFFAAWSRQKLLTEFRLAAQQQLGARRGSLGRWVASLKPHLSGIDSGNLDPEAGT
jgi:ABC-type transport system involved in multi-copper enzyme maturation permease subunit